jgi:hypothetical protein
MNIVGIKPLLTAIRPEEFVRVCASCDRSGRSAGPKVEARLDTAENPLNRPVDADCPRLRAVLWEGRKFLHSLGHLLRFDPMPLASGLHPRADISNAHRHVSNVPSPDIKDASHSVSTTSAVSSHVWLDGLRRRDVGASKHLSGYPRGHFRIIGSYNRNPVIKYCSSAAIIKDHHRVFAGAGIHAVQFSRGLLGRPGRPRPDAHRSAPVA